MSKHIHRQGLFNLFICVSNFMLLFILIEVSTSCPTIIFHNTLHQTIYILKNENVSSITWIAGHKKFVQ